MPASAERKESFLLKYKLGFPRTGADSGPLTIWARVIHAANEGPFVLEPIRHRASDGAQEWYIKYPRAAFVEYWALMNTQQGLFLFPSSTVRIEGALEITIGELAPEQQPIQNIRNAYTLTSSSVVTPMPNWGPVMERIWPTRQADQRSKLHCEPGGFFVEGQLPASFFPPGHLQNARVVALRLPRDDDEFAFPDGTASVAPNLLDSLADTLRPFWSLTSHSFRRDGYDSLKHTTGWVTAFGNFALPTLESRRLSSLVDSFSTTPDERNLIGVFALQRDSQELRWFGRDIRTRLNLGGGGVVAETTYTPERLVGRASVANSGRFAVELVAPPAPKPESIVADDSELTLTLDRTSATTPVAITIDTALNPLVAPTVPIEVVAPEAGTPVAQRPGERLWLCTDSGWAAVDTPRPRAVLDAQATPPGALLGVLELGPLMAGFSEANRPGLTIDAQATGFGAVSLELTGRSPAATQSTVERLALTITRPFLTVTTPAVFYTPPNAVPSSGLPALTSGLSPEKPAVGTPEFNLILQQLDRELGASRFRSCVFVSSNVTRKVENATEFPLTAKILFEQRTFLLSFPSEATTVWQRPAKLPLARSFPLQPDQDLSGFLDPNRGVLPFRNTNEAAVRVAFFLQGLPRVVRQGRAGENDSLLGLLPSGGPTVAANWQLTAALSGGSASYFLPTLPGLEFDPSPQVAATPEPPLWVYRHGVSALDEAYAVATESRKDPTVAAGQADRPPSPGEFPPGFDPTRVSGTEAFRFGATLPPVAVGWVHPTETNPTGSVPLSAPTVDPRPPTFQGRFPALPVVLAGREITFSRLENIAGLSADLLVTPPPQTDGLPSFSVALALTDDGSLNRERIANNGQPLLAATVQGRIVTHDGRGERQEEPDPTKRTVRSRTLGSTVPTRRYSSRELLTSGMVLDLIGVDLTEPQAGPSHSPLQSWMLHDGTGGVPRFASFRLVRRRLSALAVVESYLQVEIEAVLSPVPQRREKLPSHVRDAVPLGGEKTLSLTFRRTFDDPAQEWALHAISDGFSWQFRDTMADPQRPVLTRLVAEVTGLPLEGSLPVKITLLELTGPTGPLVLEDLAVAGKLRENKLELTEAVSYSADGFRATIKKFAIDASTLVGSPVPDAPLLREYSFTWSPDQIGTPLERELSYSQTGIAEGAWKLTIKHSNSALIEREVKATPAAPGAYIFSSIPLEGALPLLPGSSWFERVEADLILSGARFARPKVLSSLACEVRLLLREKSQASFHRKGLQQEEQEATLLVLWSIPGKLTVKLPPVALSGWLDLENQFAFLGPNSTPVRHSVRLFFDRSVWSFEALFLGEGPQEAVPSVCLADHRFSWGTRSYSFQVAQPLRLRTASQFSALYLGNAPVGNTTELKNRLTLDGSWVFWLTRPDEGALEPLAGAISFELESERWAKSVAFHLRPTGRGRLAVIPSFLARLPFGTAAARALPERRVTLTDHPREPLLSGAPGGFTIDPVRRSGRPPEVHPDFLLRGANAIWIDAPFLADLFSIEDLQVGFVQSRSREILPAFVAANGAPTNTVDAELGDWGLIFRGEHDDTHSDAATLRTPYTLGGDAAPVKSSNLLEMPFTFGTLEKPHYEGDSLIEEPRTQVQLLAFTEDDLRVIRRAGLEPTGPLTPLEWAIEELSAARRDEAAFLIVDADVITTIPRPFDQTRGARERPLWSTAPVGPGHNSDGVPPEYDRDRRQRFPALEDELQDRVVLDPPDETDELRRWKKTPQWFTYAARPEIPPPDLKTKEIAATRFRLALAGGAGRLARAERSQASVDLGHVDANQLGPLTLGSVVGMTKTEEVPFAVSDLSSQNPATRFPTPVQAPHARRDGVPRGWNVQGISHGNIVTIAAPAVDIVTWARRPGELTRSVTSGVRVDVLGEETRSFRYSPSPGEDITLRRPRAKAGPYEQVTITETATHILANRLFQYARLDLTQTLDATKPPLSAELTAVFATKAEILASSRDIQTAQTKPAIIKKLSPDLVEPFEFWLVAEASFVPNTNFPMGTKPAIRTVVVFQDSAEIPDPNSNASGPPVEETTTRVVLFENVGEELKPPRPETNEWPESYPWWPVFAGISALPTVKNGGEKDKIEMLAREHTDIVILVLQYTKSSDADDAPWVKPGAPLAAVKISKIDSANEPVLPKCVAAVLHAPSAVAEDDTRFSLCGYAQLDNDDFGPVEPTKGPQEDGTTLIAWTRVANLQTLDRLEGVPTRTEFTGSAFSFDVAFYGPGGDLVPIPVESEEDRAFVKSAKRNGMASYARDLR